jgi:hypothetical protein
MKTLRDLKPKRDPFSRTYLPAAAEAQIPFTVINRHAHVLRHCAGDHDPVRLVAPCFRGTDNSTLRRPASLLMVTQRRLVVTTQSRVLRKLRLYLNTSLHQLFDVTWNADPQRDAMQLAMTAVDGVREHFWVQMSGPQQVWRLDDALQAAFQDRLVLAA